MRTLRDGVAVVTGGASGIGLALAQAFSREGMRTLVVDLPGTRLDAVEDIVPASKAIAADVADPDAMTRAADYCLSTLGPAAVVCANAGIAGPIGARLWEIGPEEWERVLGVDVLGVVNTLRAFMPQVLTVEEGHVVITASMAGMTRSPTLPVYFSSKHAAVSIGETLKQQMERDHLPIGVSVLLPSRVETNFRESHEVGFDASMAVPEAVRALSADDVAQRVVRGIRQSEFYLFTHPESKARVDAVYRDVSEAFTSL